MMKGFQKIMEDSMIVTYETVNGVLRVSDQLVCQNSWVYVTSPTQNEIEQLITEFDLPKDFIEDPLDEDESPRVEREDNNTLIIIQTPYYDEDDEYIKYKTIPLGIILTHGSLITVSSRTDDVLQNFVKGRVKHISCHKRNRLTLQILSRTASIYLLYLKRISRMVTQIEERLEKSMKNDELQNFLDLQKSLVYFATSLKANEAVMERLSRSGLLTKFEDDRDYLDDLIIENKQAIEMTAIHGNILKSTMEAFDSMISNNLNKVMKFLTSVSIILMIPTLIASMYGMNVKLPFADNPHAFAITMGASTILTLLGIMVFIKRKWF